MGTTTENKNLSYYQRYRTAAIRFEVIGAALLLIGIGMNFVLHTSLSAVSLIFAGPGAFLLIIGGSSLRPHNLIKAFAQQCSREPCKESAQGLLEALESVKSVRLLKNSIQTIHLAVEIYSTSENADPKLIQQLQDAMEKRIIQKSF